MEKKKNQKLKFSERNGQVKLDFCSQFNSKTYHLMCN